MVPNTVFATIDIKFAGKPVELVRVDATEAMSELYVVVADVIAETAVDMEKELGSPATVTIFQNQHAARYFTGLFTSGQFIGKTEAGFHYRLTLRPSHYLYTLTQSYGIYQDKSASGIVSMSMARCNLPFDTGPFGEGREYCVQYNESDFAFMTRLMEEEGVYYYFDHDQHNHKLMIVTAPSQHTQGTPDVLVFNPNADNLHFSDIGEASDDFVQAWGETVRNHGETYVIYNDYMFEDADTPKFSRAPELGEHRGRHNFITRQAATRDTRLFVDLAKHEMALIESGRQLFTGNALTPGLECGKLFKLTDHPIDRYNTSYLLTRVHTIAFGASFQTGAGAEDDSGCWFECVRADQPWRAPMTTPRPVVHGAETALVVGPENETIYTDKWGRVRVKFHWESGVSDDRQHDLTCWIRVSNTGGLGNIILPRVGHEVVVDFMGGNPDRPLVVGRVFNSNNKPVYDLPANKTRALWRTLTYGDKNAALGDGAVDLDTGNPGAHELRFEDKSGEEEIFLHSQRDMNTRIRNDESLHVGRNQLTKIGQDSQREVGRDSLVKVARNSTVEIAENEERTIKGTSKVSVTKDHSVTLLANADYKTTGTNTVKIDGENKENYGDQSTVEVDKTLKIKGNQDIQIEANTTIKLKVGGNSIEISQSGIAIKGMVVSVEGQATAEMKSPMTTVSGDGMLTLKGGVVMIN